MLYNLNKSDEIIQQSIDSIKNTNNDIIEIILNNNDFENIKFGDIFNLIKGTIQSSKVVEVENGDGVMITQSKNINDYKKINNWILNDLNLFIGNIDSGKKFVITFYNGKCDYTNLMSLCKLKDDYKEKINIKYIYYYLKNINDYLTNNYLKGLANLSLDIEKFNLMEIPIPSLEVQEEIVNKIDNNDIIIKNLEKMIEDNKELMKKIFN